MASVDTRAIEGGARGYSPQGVHVLPDKILCFFHGPKRPDKRPRRRAVVCLRGSRQMLRELRRVGEIMQIFEKTMHPSIGRHFDDTHPVPGGFHAAPAVLADLVGKAHLAVRESALARRRGSSWKSGKPSCSRRHTSTSSTRCPARSRTSRIRTRLSSTISCSRRRPRRWSRSPPIQNTWAHRSA